MPSITPKSLVLDLLRVAEPRALAVSSLVDVGALFELSSNSMRVAIARLLAAGLLESDARGAYRLSPGAATIGAHVEAWRRGERRMRSWNGGWLAVWLPRGPRRADRAQSVRALSLLGFREGLDLLWVRPDNLSEENAETFARLRNLGLEPAAESFVAGEFTPALIERWSSTLWRARELVKRYRESLTRIEASLERLDDLPVSRQATETFRVGGEAIRILATDPLLPNEILDGSDRAALTETMRRYDQVGRRVWRELTGARSLESAPVHSDAIAG